MYRSILVPLDGTALSEAALPQAARIARRTGAVLHLARAYAPSNARKYELLTVAAGGSADGPLMAEGSDHSTLEYLRSAAGRLEEQGIASTIQLLEAPAVESLVEFGESIAADLVVVATHARSPLVRAWTGSVAGGLVRRSGRPCLLLKQQEESDPQTAERAFRHVLIPLDGSRTSEEVVPHAVALGDAGRTRYTLLHVSHPATLAGSGPTPGGHSPSWLDLQKHSAETALERVAAGLRSRSPDVRIVVIRRPHTAKAIHDYAATHLVDLVAMTTYGSGLSRMLLGNVADRVIRYSTVPVLVYRPDEYSGRRAG